jgi:hypothetical protein
MASPPLPWVEHRTRAVSRVEAFHRPWRGVRGRSWRGVPRRGGSAPVGQVHGRRRTVNVEAGAASPLDGATVADDGACAAAMTQEQLPHAADLDSRALSLRREIQVHLVVRILLPLSFVYLQQ